MLDFARTFPPEAPPDGLPQPSVLYFRLRAEFVKNYGGALSPDAFSGFGKDDADMHNQEVKKVTLYVNCIFYTNYDCRPRNI